ncbi:MAG: ATP-dependent helicase Lhr and Lhr-like helicase [Chloroflexota bacterium]|nr:ATP-dependent helicase Lhr and Lhr-like helicase [Chloroflexota bacterium]
MSAPLERFAPVARSWFESAFEAPTPVQAQGWEAVAAGSHTLMCAPTGSGKTLAAFFWTLDALAREPVPPEAERCRVLYVSPLKALTVDIERNLRAPLAGMRLEAERLGLPLPEITTAVRTGDTSAAERRGIERHPPDILITTPESLYLMLTSAARAVLTSVRWVIVDEIHSMAATKRGAHLTLSLERLSAIAAVDPQRIGLSATQRPLEEVARFLGGTDRDVAIIDTGERKRLEISVEVPVEDMANLDRDAAEPEPYGGPAAAIGDSRHAPRRSIWPAIHPRLLELIRQHRSTIVFVNSRRLAERLAARLNEMAAAEDGLDVRGPAQVPPGGELVRAHHGSIAREQRLEIEDALKSGRLPAIIATSSLDLGIDMGAVDLVIQVESPTSVSSGIQRIGRAGHQVGEASRGVIFPKHRGDLLETAVVVERMLAGEIERTRVPRNPIDVLAQQLVAMTALDEWKVEDARALARRAYPFAELGDRAFEATLDMLAGRYPSDDFAELRPRIVWDRVAGTIRGRAGAQRLAVTSGGTIPDRGLYTVNLFDGEARGDTTPERGFAMAGRAAPPGGRRPGRRIGELDEEMVYEMRVGQTFVLGATTWRIVDITHSEVQVVPAPGEPGTIAFWHGDSQGRPVEVGEALGRMTRELRAATPAAASARLREGAGLDPQAAANLLQYLDDQAAAGAVPDDRTVVVERFRDQLGDWRLCVLTPYGARVHAPWALAAAARLEEQMGVDVQSIHTDDGFALRLPDIDNPPDVDVLFLDPDEVRELVTAQLRGSALFASRFRENAARALLLPRRRPTQRVPLWQQRQRAHDLLQVASRHPDFPVMLETYRECLTDAFELDALVDLMRRVRSREVRVVSVETDRASPFAGSLMFDFIAQYIYEGAAPLAESRAQALSLDRELLAELLGAEELRELISPEVMEAVELELQGLVEERWPRDVDEAADVLRRLGDLGLGEAQARGISTDWLARLEREHRAARVRLTGEDRWIAAEDAARYRDGLGVSLPVGLPLALLADNPEDPDARGAVGAAGRRQRALASLAIRYARTHVPFLAADLAARWSLPAAAAARVLEAQVGGGRLLSGEFRPGGAGREFCHPEVLVALRRRSLAALRREVEPVPVEVLGRFLPAWNGVGAQARGLDRLVEVVHQLQGAAIPVSVLERDVLPARVAGYTPSMLDHLMSVGDVVWAGRGALATSDGRVALYLRADAARLLPLPAEPPAGGVHDALRDHLATRGASFFADLVRAGAAAGGADPDAILDALWEMVWAGEVTNDTFLPVRARTPRVRSSRRTRRPLMRLGPPGSEGRWSLVADLRDAEVSSTERLHAQAGALLQRYGVLTREAVLAEGTAGGFTAMYPVLRAMEEAGRIRRGYFVDGLGASQFALPGAVDRLRSARRAGRADDADGPGPDSAVGLAATDPANPYGVTIPWPASAGRPARAAGAFVVLEGGELRLYLERGGRSLLSFGSVGREAMTALAATAARAGKVEVQSLDGEPVAGSTLEPLMREVGFGVSPRGLVLWPERNPAAGLDA